MQLEQLPSAERRKMCLSDETIEGLRITGTGVISLSPPPPHHHLLNICAYTAQHSEL